jgi:hypothetical protein
MSHKTQGQSNAHNAGHGQFWRKAFEHQAMAMINEAVEIAARVYDLTDAGDRNRVLELFAGLDARTAKAWEAGDLNGVDWACRDYVQSAREGLADKVWC